MSGNCQAFAFGHSSGKKHLTVLKRLFLCSSFLFYLGSLHLFSKGENETFNDFSEPTLIVEPVR